MRLSRFALYFGVVAGLMCGVGEVEAKDVYYAMKLRGQGLIERDTEKDVGGDDIFDMTFAEMSRHSGGLCRVSLKGGEGYYSLGKRVGRLNRFSPGRLLSVYPHAELVVRIDDRFLKAGKGKGYVGVPNGGRFDGEAWGVYWFDLLNEDSHWREIGVEDFKKAKGEFYARNGAIGAAGDAWFDKWAEAMGGSVEAETARWGRRGEAGLFDLFSGARAIGENLSLDYGVLMRDEDEVAGEMVKVDGIKGITVAGMDFGKLLGDSKPKLDGLSGLVPFDQHGFYFREFTGMLDLFDRLDGYGTKALMMSGEDGVDYRVRARYERQLCIGGDVFSRLVGPSVIKSVAVTGSDLYFKGGTDIAVLFEGFGGERLSQALRARRGLGGNAEGAEQVSGKVGGVEYEGLVSGDREVCSYQIRLGDVVVVSNSLAQLERIVKVKQGKIKGMDSGDDYRFFRKKYVMGGEGEAGFFVLPDEAIRRWCGPRWRIGQARRAQAYRRLVGENFGRMMTNHELWEMGNEYGDGDFNKLPLLGRRKHVEGGVDYGSVTFLTPVIELGIDEVTMQEKKGYERWRVGFESGWRGVFDPIAVRLGFEGKVMKGAVSVMPVKGEAEGMLNTQMLMNFFKEGELRGSVGDPHVGTLMHIGLALGENSFFRSFAENMMVREGGGKLSVKSFDWIGDGVSVYADSDDSFWEELEKIDHFKEKTRRIKEFQDLPIGLTFEVKNHVKLGLFLAGAKAVMGDVSGDHMDFKEMTYRGKGYTRLWHRREDRYFLHYYIGDGLLTFSLNERVIKRAIDRDLMKAGGKQVVGGDRKWLGKHVGAYFDAKGMVKINAMMSQMGVSGQRETSFANLPILNEWKRLYPGRDPVAVHEDVFGVKLSCPGGKGYVWNEKYQTMESAVFGNWYAFKEVKMLVGGALDGFGGMQFGMEFKDDSLHTRFELELKE